jgi:hypothetical protein
MQYTTREKKDKKYIVSLTDGGTQALPFQLGAIAGLREVGILKDVRAIVASGSGCVLATLLMKNASKDVWQDFCSPSSSPFLLQPPPPQKDGEIKIQHKKDVPSQEEARANEEEEGNDKSSLLHRVEIPRGLPTNVPLSGQFCSLYEDVKKYACTNIETWMLQKRWCSDGLFCRWTFCGDVESGGFWEYKRAMHGMYPSSPNLDGCLTTSSNHYPFIFLQTLAKTPHGKQLVAFLNRSKTEPTDAPSSIEKDMKMNGGSLPRIYDCSPYYTTNEIIARMTLPGELGHGDAKFGPYSWPTEPATTVDPLGIQSAQLARLMLQDEVTSDSLILLDGFTGTSAFNHISVEAQSSVLSTSQRIQLSSGQKLNSEEICCFKSPCVMTAEVPAAADEAPRLRGISTQMFSSLMNAGYNSILHRFSKK